MLSLMLWPLDYDKMNNMKMAQIHHVFPAATMNRSVICMQEKAVTAVTARNFEKYDMINYVMTTAIRIIQIMFSC